MLSHDTDLRSLAIRVLEELVRIGVNNYRSPDYLQGPFRRFAQANSIAPRCWEVGFYQPFILEALSRDEFLAPQLGKGSELAGGRIDLSVGRIPIEAKVIYPDEGVDGARGARGVGQSVQYSALTRFAFLAVLDCTRRVTSEGLSNIENDIRIERRTQYDGPHDAIIIRVQHVVGFEAPSCAKDRKS